MTEKNKLFNFNKKINWTAFLFIPLFLSLFLVYHFFHNASFQLEMFSGRSISVATYEGIDIAKRVSTFYNGIIVFILLALSFSYFIIRLKTLISQADLKLLNAVSAAGVALMFFQLLGAEISTSLHLIISIQLVIALGITLKRTWKFNDSQNTYAPLVAWIITLSFCLSFLQVQLFQLAGIQGNQSLAIFSTVFSSVLLLFYLLQQKTVAFTHEDVQGKIFITAPLAILPLLSVISTELFMILNQHDIHAPGIRIIHFGLLAIIALSMFYRRRKWRKQGIAHSTNLFDTLGRLWFPMICIGIAALATYKPIVSPTIDLFEDANRILPLQQFFDFGKIPFLDTFSSHALSDFGPGALFSLLNGYNPLGGFVYQFIIPVLVTVLIYFLVSKIKHQME